MGLAGAQHRWHKACSLWDMIKRLSILALILCAAAATQFNLNGAGVTGPGTADPGAADPGAPFLMDADRFLSAQVPALDFGQPALARWSVPES